MRFAGYAKGVDAAEAIRAVPEIASTARLAHRTAASSRSDGVSFWFSSPSTPHFARQSVIDGADGESQSNLTLYPKYLIPAFVFEFLNGYLPA